jgi:phenylpyruvate tautomerase PptA (4-oxalocrotonate tautomerase family)
MPFVEVYSSASTSLSEEKRQQISERLVSEVMEGEGAPDNENTRSLSWLVWHEPKLWSIGGRPVQSGERPFYAVRVSMPAASLDDEKRAEVVRRVTKVLAEADDDHDRFYQAPPVSFVLINEVPEGNWGSAGMVFRFEDVVSFIVKGVPGQMSMEEVREALELARSRANEEPAIAST